MAREIANMKKQSVRRIRRYTRILFTNVFVVIIVVFVLMVVVRTFLVYLQSTNASTVSVTKPVKRYLISYMWWPTNIRKTPTYYFILTWQCLATSYGTLIAAVSDAFTCSLMLVVSARAEMLTTTALKAIALSKPNVRLTAKFRYWLQSHQHYLKMLQQINKLTSPLVFVSYLHSLVTCIIAAFVIMKANSETLTMIAGTYALLGTIQLALLSHAGQKVIETNARLSSCLLGTIANEVLSRGANRSALQVLMARTSIIDDRFARISGFGFFTVSLEFFSSMISVYVSFVLLLQKLKSGEPQIMDNSNGSKMVL